MQGREEGIVQGREEGIMKGREKGIEEVVKNLVASGQLSISQIAGLTGLPESFIIKVRNSMKCDGE